MVTSFTRSRPYKKNDNAHVEQKNWSHVRQLFAYDRFEDHDLVDLMNDLYANEWSLYQNHFIEYRQFKHYISSKPNVLNSNLYRVFSYIDKQFDQL